MVSHLRRRHIAALGTLPWLTACGLRPPIRLGFLGDLSGRGGDFSAEAHDGVSLGVEQLNEAGGTNGELWKLLTKDYGGGTEREVEAVQALLAAGVRAIIGPYASPVALRMLPYANARGVPLVGPDHQRRRLGRPRRSSDLPERDRPRRRALHGQDAAQVGVGTGGSGLRCTQHGLFAAVEPRFPCGFHRGRRHRWRRGRIRHGRSLVFFRDRAAVAGEPAARPGLRGQQRGYPRAWPSRWPSRHPACAWLPPAGPAIRTCWRSAAAP